MVGLESSQKKEKKEKSWPAKKRVARFGGLLTTLGSQLGKQVLIGFRWQDDIMWHGVPNHERIGFIYVIHERESKSHVVAMRY